MLLRQQFIWIYVLIVVYSYYGSWSSLVFKFRFVIKCKYTTQNTNQTDFKNVVEDCNWLLINFNVNCFEMNFTDNILKSGKFRLVHWQGQQRRWKISRFLSLLHINIPLFRDSFVPRNNSESRTDQWRHENSSEGRELVQLCPHSENNVWRQH